MIRFSYSNEDTKDGEKELASTKCGAKRQALTHTNPREETSGVGSVRIQSKLRATSLAILNKSARIDAASQFDLLHFSYGVG